jgi:hypothetical protein
MQKHFSVFMKLMVTVLLFGVASFAKAATVTYSLTTKVDGRTITATANLNAGDNLNDKMPQTLWRAYTTYKYYSDADLTQEITEAPASGGTVYVDYEFDPPFILSEEGQDPVYHYLRTYNYSGSNNYLVIYDQAAENEWGTYKETILTWKSSNGATPKAGSNYPIAKKGHDQWAFYGDGYDFQVRLNDSSIANNYLIWRSTTRNETPMGLGAKPEVGWQLYVNTAENSKISGTMAMGPYNSTNYLASLENVNSCVWTDKLDTSDQYFDEHNQLVYKPAGTSGTTMNKNNLWWYAFFATPVTDPANSTDIWHVTYKILGADGTWYDDIVLQKRANNLTPTWPVQDFNPKEGCEYDYFYADATFSEKFEGDMPATGNTTLYIKEKEINYISQPWKTLVLPFAIDDLAEYFGADYEGVPSVNVSELQDVQGTLTEAGDQSFYNCKLFFNPVTKIEANKPYLFKVNRVNERIINEMYAAEGTDPCEVTEVADPVNAGISACMQGTLEGYDMDASDGLSFYFGYDETNDAYNFYRVSARIPKNRCWFYISDNRAAGAKLQVVFDSEVNSINTQIADKSAKGNIYNVNGQLMGTQKSNLPKGLYIVNGKKMVIK